MEQINTNKKYNEYVKQKSPNSPILKDCFNAFWVAQLVKLYWTFACLKEWIILWHRL